MKRQTIVKVLFVSVLLVVLSAFALIMPSAAEANPLNVAYCNLSFENEVHILYAIESNDPDVQLLVWNGTQDAYTNDTPHDTAEVVARNYNINGVSHTVFSYDGLAAKQMTDVVYARAYNPTTGEYGALDKYSILQYAYKMLGKTGNNPSTNEGLKAMLTQMLEYGASAQTCFGYKPDRLANANWVQIQVMGDALEDGFSCGLYLEGDAVTLTAPETDADGVPFMHWQDESGAVLTKNRSYSLTVGNTNKAYTAFYAYCIHKEVIDPAVPATCTETGLTEGVHCSECGEVLVAQETVDALGHTEVVDPAVPATCTETGLTEGSHCVVCGEVIVAQDIVSIVDHTYESNALCAICNKSSLIFELTDIGYSVIGIENLAQTVEIPAIYNDIPITVIADNAFKGSRLLECITIPHGITHIGKNAFSDCTSLIAIDLPSSITNIGSAAFSGCNNIERMTLPFVGDQRKTSVMTYQYPLGYIFGTTSYTGAKAIKQYYYGSSTSSTTYNTYYIPSSLKSITVTGGHILYGAFRNCSMLTNIILDEGVSSIAQGAFTSCVYLKSIIISNSVTDIGYGAFTECYRLESITLPFVGAGRSSSPSGTEKDCFGYIFGKSETGTEQYYSAGIGWNTVKFYIPATLKNVTVTGGYIHDRVFFNCKNIMNITLGESVVDISDEAFAFCNSLENIRIPDGMSTIHYMAFRSCSSLKRITIPSSVTIIEYCALAYCSSLSDIIFAGTITEWNSITKESNWNLSTGSYTIHCTDGTITKS